MSDRARLLGLSLLAVTAAGLWVVAIAWACTPQAFVSLSPSSGPPGTVVTVSGRGFVADAPVEIRMGAVDSAPVATATGPTFAVTVAIPQDAAAGYRLVGATGYDRDGQVEGSTARAFRVTGTAAPSTAPARQAPASRHARPRHATPSPARTPVRHSAPSQSRHALHPARPALRGRPPAAAVHAAPAHAAPATAVGGTHALGAVNAGGQPAGKARTVSEVNVARHADGPWAWHARSARAHHAAAAPARRGATQTGRSAPWDVARAPDSQRSGGPTTGLAIGAGLLAAGLVALFAGFAVAEVRRRRAPARTRR